MKAEYGDGEPRAVRGPAPRKNRSFPRYAIIGLLVVVCIAWFLFDKARKDAEGGKSLIELATPAREEAVLQNAGQTGAPQPIEPPLALSVSERVDQFFLAPNCTPLAAAQLAAELPKATAGEKDAVYRLWHYAASNGEVSAFMDYGACLDPSRPRWGGIEKDAPLAYGAYKNAEANNVDGALAAMDGLMAWLKEKAATGDAQARKWLSTIELAND